MTRTLAAMIFWTGLISACSSELPAVIQTVRFTMGGGVSGAEARLNTEFRYLRVTSGGKVAFFALGNVERDPQGAIEVWYSAQREVLRLQNGRVVGAVGLTTEWRNVVLPELPSWSTLAHAPQPTRWMRTRDVMPGYRFGLRDVIAARPITAPKKSALVNLEPQSLTWFEEQAEAEPLATHTRALFSRFTDVQVLPSALYAVESAEGRDIVVYAEQCLAPDICFSWQRWNPQKP